MRRLLVTTALEETWGDGVPVLFLGEWCRIYNRKHIWSEMNALVAKPFGIEVERKLSDFDYADQLVDQLLSELAEVLNKYHQVQHSERYWNIILGHWLRRYVSVAFNRYYTLDQAMKNYDVSETLVLAGANYNLATENSYDFIFACGDDQWNHILYSRIMRFREDIELNQALSPLRPVDICCGEPKTSEKYLSVSSAFKLMKKFCRFIASRDTSSIICELLGSMGTKFGRDTDAFIIGSYLPINVELVLQLALGQVPQKWRSCPFKQTKKDLDQRIDLNLNYDQLCGFEKYVRWQLPEVLPTCYFEGYKNLTKVAEEMPWPKKPKFIFTSNNFDTDEIFKFWTALKVGQGVPYIAGQHGNNYGTHAWFGTPNIPERAASDKFITWGWSERKHKTIPAFVFTKAGRSSKKNVKDGGLLLVENHLPQNQETYDVYYEHLLYMEDQFRIVESLPNNIFQQVTVRLHGGNKQLRFCEEQRWKDRSPQTKIERDGLNMEQSISQNRLIVYSYDSSGILEGLLLNIPTICFWRNGLSHLLPSAKPFYGLLHNVGILFYSPEAAAQFIDLHWDDISEWWKSEKVQDARQIFCDQYARTTDNPVKELKSILTGSL
jgi:putative transferase (TIGR04331 family)